MYSQMDLIWVLREEEKGGPGGSFAPVEKFWCGNCCELFVDAGVADRCALNLCGNPRHLRFRTE